MQFWNFFILQCNYDTQNVSKKKLPLVSMGTWKILALPLETQPNLDSLCNCKTHSNWLTFSFLKMNVEICRILEVLEVLIARNTSARFLYRLEPENILKRFWHKEELHDAFTSFKVELTICESSLTSDLKAEKNIPKKATKNPTIPMHTIIHDLTMNSVFEYFWTFSAYSKPRTFWNCSLLSISTIIKKLYVQNPASYRLKVGERYKLWYGRKVTF